MEQTSVKVWCGYKNCIYCTQRPEDPSALYCVHREIEHYLRQSPCPLYRPRNDRIDQVSAILDRFYKKAR